MKVWAFASKIGSELDMCVDWALVDNDDEEDADLELLDWTLLLAAFSFR